MKKFTALLISASVLLSNAGIVMAESGMESALPKVKSRIEIPANLTEFETSSNERGGKSNYSFRWSNPSESQSISAECDEKGNILSLSSYDRQWYEGDNVLKIDTGFNIDTLSELAENEMKKLVPHLFADENDLLVQVPYTRALSLKSQSRYTFDFLRKHNGTEVKDNYASISLIRNKEGFAVCNANIVWDYETDFENSPEVISPAKAAEKLFEKFPPNLLYRKTYDDKYLIEYISPDVKYIDAKTGGERFEDPYDYDFFYRNNASADKEMSQSAGGSAPALTPAEIAELSKNNSLKDVNELLNYLYSVEEFKVSRAENDKDISSHTYKSNNGYITNIYISNEDGTSCSASFDAESGRLLSFYRYSRDTSRNISEEEKALAQSNSKAFLEKYHTDKTAQAKSENQEQGVVYTRLVNDISYPQNYLSAYWNTEIDCITSFTIEWDNDETIKRLPSPEGIISVQRASDIIFEKYPVKMIYIKSDEKFVPCYTASQYGIRIDAKSGRLVSYDGGEVTAPLDSNYKDAENHWIKSIAKELARYGIALSGELLRPDDKITQADFLKLVYSGVCGYSNSREIGEVYHHLEDIKVLTDEEVNSDAPLSRENAIRYLLRAMGIKEVAEIEGIYICDFADGIDIAPDRLGYCAIAKGWGIIRGSDNMLKPKDNISRAEALVMVYNYLTRSI